MKQSIPLVLAVLSFNSILSADDGDTKELKGMSDPLAVYTRGGAGVTSRGLNIKVGIQTKGGDSDKSIMNVFEVKGFAGDAIGWDGPYVRSNSVDSLRYRKIVTSTAETQGKYANTDHS